MNLNGLPVQEQVGGGGELELAQIASCIASNEFSAANQANAFAKLQDCESQLSESGHTLGIGEGVGERVEVERARERQSSHQL